MTENIEQQWAVKGATLSDKSARKEFKLTQEEILEGISDGKLHYRVNYVYGNPWFRLLRIEVEILVEEKHGSKYLQENKFKTELKHINKELKTLGTQIRVLEIKKKELLVKLGMKR